MDRTGKHWLELRRRISFLCVFIGRCISKQWTPPFQLLFGAVYNVFMTSRLVYLKMVVSGLF